MTHIDLMKHYERGLESQNWLNIESLMHDDVCVTFSSGTFKGKQEVQQAFEKTFALIKDEKYSILNLHWVFSDENTAVCIYEFNWEGIINGKHASGGGRGTSVLIKTSSEWQIITEHLGPYSS